MDDKVVIVTGGGSGMGQSMVHEFVRKGARVATIGRTLSSIQATVDALETPDRALAVQGDVSDAASVDAAVEKILEWGGRIDVLCNNAAVQDTYRPAHELSVEEWDEIIRIDLTGPFLTARAVIPTMLAQGSGVIINTGSTASFSAAGGGTAYTTAKHGVLGLTRQLTFDYGKRGIRVNMIAPGAVKTGLTEEMASGADDSMPDIEGELRRTPAGRWGDPTEIARLAVYLASDAADFIHGSSIVIDGGWLTAARNPF